jgi:hypothetical protein
VQRGADEDRWLVELGVVEGGDRIYYQMTASNDDETVASPSYRFETRSWWRWYEVSPRPALNLSPIGPTTTQVAIGSSSPTASEPASSHRFDEASGTLLVSRHGREPLPIKVRCQYEGERLVQIELTAPLSPDERIAGFGERFDAVEQRGRAPDVVVYEQYKN